MMTDVEMKDETNSNLLLKEKIKESTLPLIEKYRPKSLNDIVSHEDILNTIGLFLKKKTIPHLLFHGPPGTGKTSSILAIARSLFGDHFQTMTLELNASDDRGINVVRDRIKEFCNTTLLTSKGMKLVILDEADMMTSAAQFALRRVIERYTKNARFCLICNQVSKIIPAIQSRCMKFRFSPLKREQCALKIKEICSSENIPIDDETIYKIIEIGQGDMRKILNIIESTSMSFDEITIKSVYASTGLPSEEDMSYLINLIKEKEIGEAFLTINEYKSNNGFSLTDIVLQTLKIIRNTRGISLDDKISLYKRFKKMDYLNCIGGNEKFVITNLIGALKIINFD